MCSLGSLGSQTVSGLLVCTAGQPGARCTGRQSGTGMFRQMLYSITQTCPLRRKAVQQLLGSLVQSAGQSDLRNLLDRTLALGMTELAVNRYPEQMTLKTGT